jgi:hypothetical protein
MTMIEDDRARITALEAAIEELQLRDSRREREQAALAQILIPDQTRIRAEMHELRRSLESDLELSKAAIDARLEELRETDPATAELLAGMVRLHEGGMTIANTLADIVDALLARLERLERLVAPALEGRARLLASEV